MKTKKILSLFLAFSLLFVLLLNLAGCSRKIAATDLMAAIVPQARTGSPETVADEKATAAADFAVRLFRESYDGKNTLLSPLSVLIALAMTANGANGETKSQMERVFGMTVEELNDYFTAYLAALPQDENVKLSIANSIWLRDAANFTVKKDFLQKNADVYGAGAYRAPFNSSTVRDVNLWVKDKTDGMIDKILDNLSGQDMAVLVNALAFDAKWAIPYTQKYQVKPGVFHKADGTETKVTFLSGTEQWYIADGDQAVGFIKLYKGGKYAFAAILPNADVPIAEYLAALDGAKIRTLLGDAKTATVETKLPKFETKYSVSLESVLSQMGMPNAFSPSDADFSGISETLPLYIDEVLHKTYIEVAETGTRAGAVTAVKGKAMGMDPGETMTVILNRPFIYLLFDTETCVPFFIGVLNDPNG